MLSHGDLTQKSFRKKEKKMEAEVLGVDIGGVIMDKANDSTDTSFFSENFLETTATPIAP